MNSSKKSPKALEQGRKSNSLSAPVKELGGYQQAQHLGDLTKHNDDAIRQEEWIRQQKAAKLKVKPEDLVESTGLAETATLVGFAGSELDEKIIKETEWDAEKLNEVLGTKGLVLSLAFAGEPGRREWTSMEGAEWVSTIMKEKRQRGSYVNASRKVVTNTSKVMQVMLARLSPWTGSTAGPLLVEQQGELKRRVVKVCEEFSKRYNVDVLGVVVHRESDYDLHIHIVFSARRERVTPKKVGARVMRAELKKIRDKIRMDLRARGKPATNRAVSAQMKEMEQDGSLSLLLQPMAGTDRVRYERIKEKNSGIFRSTLGHAFLCKLQTFRAAAPAEKEAVAAFRDRSTEHPHFDRSFRERFAKAESRGEILEDRWWNLWLTERWNQICLEGLGTEISEKAAEAGREAAKNYLRFGSTVPTLIERMAVEKRELEERHAALGKRMREAIAKGAHLEEANRNYKKALEAAEMKISDLQLELSYVENQVEVSEVELERLRTSFEETDKQSRELEDLLTPSENESLMDATHALIEKTQRLQRELESSQKDLSELEAEAEPLRKLSELVKAFISMVLEMGPALGKELWSALSELAAAVGITLPAKRKNKIKDTPSEIA